MWSASQSVLHWIANETTKYDCFVENRLRFIRASSAFFRYVPTACNPADLATRGCSPTELSGSILWWHGPPWLADAEQNWPAGPLPPIEHPMTIETCDSEAQGPLQEQVYSAGLKNSRKPEQTAHNLLDVRRFNSWIRLRRVMAWVQRSISVLRRGPHSTGPLAAAELRNAAQRIIKDTQALPQYQAERERYAAHLCEDGLWRCTGRMANSANPSLIYLPSRSKISSLIAQNIHEEMMHAGASTVIARLRDTYWLPRARTTVKQAINSCYLCRRWRARPFKLPAFPPLPLERVSPNPPFRFTGVDYMGPIVIKNCPPSKRWICLFTCLTVRAVHLEIAEDLSGPAFLNCLRRFIARRGQPEHLLPDNGTQFQ